MIELTINELRQIQLEILSDVDAFCRKHSIRYSLCGGTLLGAVRHKGYIPWDDDIDIMMPRPDYNRFVSLYTSSLNYVVDMSKVRGYRETFVKICRRDTVMVDKLLKRSSFGINIDLFPIDGVPECYHQEYVGKILTLKERIAKYCPFYLLVGSRRFYWMIKFFIKRIMNLQFKSTLKMKKEFNDFLESNPFETSFFAGVISGSYGYKEVVDKDVFVSYSDIKFEDFSFKAITRYDEYLSSIYGQYMVLPPIEKQCSPHQYKAYANCDIVR